MNQGLAIRVIGYQPLSLCWNRYSDHQGTGEVRIPGDDSEVYEVSYLERCNEVLQSTTVVIYAPSDTK